MYCKGEGVLNDPGSEILLAREEGKQEVKFADEDGIGKDKYNKYTCRQTSTGLKLYQMCLSKRRQDELFA